VIYVRQGDGCAEVVCATDNGLEVQKLDMAGLLALIETASRIALILQRDSYARTHIGDSPAHWNGS